MIEELDRVVLTHDLPGKKLKAGDVGTVVMIYKGGEAFEVEFMTLSGETLRAGNPAGGSRYCARLAARKWLGPRSGVSGGMSKAESRDTLAIGSEPAGCGRDVWLRVGRTLNR